MRPPLTGLTLAVIGIVVTASLAVNGVVLSRSGSDSTSSIPAQIGSESGADSVGGRPGGGGSRGGGSSASRSSSRPSASRSSERRPSVERPSERRPSVERPSERRPSVERPGQLPELRPGDRRQEIRDKIADRLKDRLPNRIPIHDDDDDDDTYVFLDQQFLTDRVIVVLISNLPGVTGDVEVWLDSQMDPPVLVANALVDGLSELATYTLCVDSLLIATGKTDEQGTLFLEGAVRFTGNTVSGLTASINEGGGCDAGVSMNAVIP